MDNSGVHAAHCPCEDCSELTDMEVILARGGEARADLRDSTNVNNNYYAN